jgi:hypothetical protein
MWFERDFVVAIGIAAVGVVLWLVWRFLRWFSAEDQPGESPGRGAGTAPSRGPMFASTPSHAETFARRAGETLGRQPFLAGVLAGVVVSGLAVYLVVRPSERERHDAGDYSRVETIATRHEACLRDLSEGDTSPRTLDEAHRLLSRLRSKAGDCFHGAW